MMVLNSRTLSSIRLWIQGKTSRVNIIREESVLDTIPRRIRRAFDCILRVQPERWLKSHSQSNGSTFYVQISALPRPPSWWLKCRFDLIILLLCSCCRECVFTGKWYRRDQKGTRWSLWSALETGECLVLKECNHLVRFVRSRPRNWKHKCQIWTNALRKYSLKKRLSICYSTSSILQEWF